MRKNTRHEAAVARWHEIISRQAASGMNASAFCREDGISGKQFYQWRSCLRSLEADGELELREVLPHAVSSPLPDRPSPGADSGVSILAGCLTISLARDFDGETLRRVLELAGGSPC